MHMLLSIGATFTVVIYMAAVSEHDLGVGMDMWLWVVNATTATLHGGTPYVDTTLPRLISRRNIDAANMMYRNNQLLFLDINKRVPKAIFAFILPVCTIRAARTLGSALWL